MLRVEGVIEGNQFKRIGYIKSALFALKKSVFRRTGVPPVRHHRYRRDACPTGGARFFVWNNYADLILFYYIGQKGLQEIRRGEGASFAYSKIYDRAPRLL